MRIGFAGAGNMAAAMAQGWATVEAETPRWSRWRSPRGSGRAQELAREVGGEAVENLGELPERSDVVVLAFKPNALQSAAAGSVAAASMISVLAGSTTEACARRSPTQPSCARCRTSPSRFDGRDLLRARRSRPGTSSSASSASPLGTLVPIDEAAMDAATAVMSCSPAYIALVAEALARAGADAGLSGSLAHELVADTLAGTAELLRRRDPGAIRRAVASPGGATEAGLEALAERDLEAAVHEAVRASLERMRL